MVSTEVYWARVGAHNKTMWPIAAGICGLIERIRNWKTRAAEIREEPLVQQGTTS